MSQNKRQQTCEHSHMNKCGDKYMVNEYGQITLFRYSEQDAAYSFAYGDDGSVASISSSSGWTWKKTQSPDFNGWVVRNYFDRWQVPATDCAEVIVDQHGIKTCGKNTSLMGLPEPN